MRSSELGGAVHLIEGIIPARQLVIVVGESGLGKSPLLYQACICIATGKPFLGRPVQRGVALYADFENGVDDVQLLTGQLSKHLGLTEPPQDFLCFNGNDAPPNWGGVGFGMEDMVREAKPALLVIDSLASYSGYTEEKNSAASELYTRLRKLMQETGVTVVLVHHPRKASEKIFEGAPALDSSDAEWRRWFMQARGAGSLIAGADIRVGVDRPRNLLEGAEEDTLVIRGYGRLRGEIPPIYLTRAYDDDGAVLGYRTVGALERLSVEQQGMYGALPQRFRFKDVQPVYFKSAQPADNFLKRLLGLGLARKEGLWYVKVPPESAESNESGVPAMAEQVQ